jgi:hypothetical protein
VFWLVPSAVPLRHAIVTAKTARSSNYRFQLNKMAVENPLVNKIIEEKIEEIKGTYNYSSKSKLSNKM